MGNGFCINKKTIKTGFVIIATIAIVISGIMISGQNSSASWKEDEEGKRYYENEEGGIVTGFFEIDGELYHFSKEGYLETGKFYDETQCAYYYADENGIIQTGIIVTDNGFYLTDDAGKIRTGLVEYEGNHYFVNGNGEPVRGWFQYGDDWYYAGTNGIILTGFLELDGYRYYLDENGVRVSDTTREIDGTYYVFNADGSIDENATLLYDVYQYVETEYAGENSEKELVQSPKLQACAIMRASGLKDGYALNESGENSMENLLKNRGVMCKGGYEFSYGGLPKYGVEDVLSDMRKDVNMKEVLTNPDIKEFGLGVYQEDNIIYFDFIFIK